MNQSHDETHWVQLLHRLTGLGVFLFLAIHLLHIWLVSLGPEPFNTITAIFRHPAARFFHLVLFFSVLFHALNGVRITLLNFLPGLSRYQRHSIYLTAALLALIFVPSALIILMDGFLPGL
jgi:succinate dehydrogenase / fumarate reductase cytochrome b subunit